MKLRDTIWLYVAVLFIMSYLWQLLIFLTGGVDSGLFPFLMFFPAIVTLAFRLITRQGFRNVGWGFSKWWYAVFALFVPLGLTLGLVALLSKLGWAMLSVFTFNEGMMVDSKVGLVLGTAPQPISFFALNLAISFVGICLMGSIFMFGEEFAWQGYLLQKLLRKFSITRGFLLLGVIWGYWHLPIVLMGYNFPNNPVVGALVFMPMSTLFHGIFEGWLYLRSRSIWMPVLAHASINTAAGILFGGMVIHQHELLIRLMWLAVYGAVAALCWISLIRSKPKLWQDADPSADRSHYAGRPEAIPAT